jgi:hypothetical protein
MYIHLYVHFFIYHILYFYCLRGVFFFHPLFPYIFDKKIISAKEGFNGYISSLFLLDRITVWLIVVKYDILRHVAK